MTLIANIVPELATNRVQILANFRQPKQARTVAPIFRRQADELGEDGEEEFEGKKLTGRVSSGRRAA